MTINARIRSFADRIERLDEEIKALNGDKKEVYAEMKGEGFDTKAFKAAHRRHLAHEQNSITAQEGEALTDLYFVALQGAQGAESPPAVKSGAANGLPEKPSRARAREQTEPLPDGASRPVESSGGWTVSADAPAAPIQNTEPEGYSAGEGEPLTDETVDGVSGPVCDVIHTLKSADLAHSSELQPTVTRSQPAEQAAGVPRMAPAADLYTEADMDIPDFLRRPKRLEVA